MGVVPCLGAGVAGGFERLPQLAGAGRAGGEGEGEREQGRSCRENCW